MPRRLSMYAVFAVLAMAVSVSACSDGALSTPTESLIGPSAAGVNGHGPPHRGGPPHGNDRSRGGDDGSEASGEYSLVESPLPADEVSAIFGRRGGTLELAGHKMVVRGNTVQAPTEFTLRVRGDGLLSVELTATDVRTGNDIGAEGFDKPVMLRLSYDSGQNVGPFSDLTVVRMTDDGGLEPIRTVTTGGGHVMAWVDSFSAFCMAMN